MNALVKLIIDQFKTSVVCVAYEIYLSLSLY